MSSAPPDESPDLWMPENAPGLYQRTSYPVRKPVTSRHSSSLTQVHLADTPVHFQFESLPAALSHHRLPGPPYDGESTAPLHILPTQVHPNDGLASESQPPHDLAESRRIWILENAPSEYWRIYSSVRGPITSRHSISLTQAHLGCRCSRTLPVRITAGCFWPATSTWPAIQRGKRSATSRFANSGAP
jgi:hypothetical protein